MPLFKFIQVQIKGKVLLKTIFSDVRSSRVNGKVVIHCRALPKTKHNPIKLAVNKAGLGLWIGDRESLKNINCPNQLIDLINSSRLSWKNT